jgi:hypothetical protein
VEARHVVNDNGSGTRLFHAGRKEKEKAPPGEGGHPLASDTGTSRCSALSKNSDEPRRLRRLHAPRAPLHLTLSGVLLLKV